MRARWWAPGLAALAWLLVAAAGEAPIAQVLDTPASEVEAGLPAEPLGDWLRGLLPAEAEPVFRTVRCPRAARMCVRVEVDIVSRARVLWLEFATDPPRFLGGKIGAADAERQPPITALADLPGRLVAPIRPYPLDCPEGTRLRLREHYAGLHEWCEDTAGRKHGPARSWFSTGRYLMSRGRYDRGERTGAWLRCSRFEACETRIYP